MTESKHDAPKVAPALNPTEQRTAEAREQTAKVQEAQKHVPASKAPSAKELADPPKQHASSTPDQASQSQKDSAPNLTTVAPDPVSNPIEDKTAEMAAQGIDAAAIAAYREDAMSKIGGAPKVKTAEEK